jgi:hypothetical protein
LDEDKQPISEEMPNKSKDDDNQSTKDDDNQSSMVRQDSLLLKLTTTFVH